MTTHQCPVSTAQTERQLLRMLRDRCGPAKFEMLRHAIPVLAELLDETHAHPMAHFYAAVREVVIERCPMRWGQYSGAIDDAHLEQCVAMICEVMEEMRCAAVQSGTWSDTPCPEQFFG